MELAHGVGGGGLDGVGDDEHALGDAVAADHHRRAVTGLGDRPAYGLGHGVEDVGPADRDRTSVDGAARPESREAGEVVDPREVGPGGGHDGAGQRVLGGLLDGRSEAEEVVVGRLATYDGHPAGGHGAGLVEHDRVDGAGGLEHLGSADHDAELGAAAGADHERGRCREAEGAGAGDDEDRDGCGERLRRRTAERQPADQGEEGDPQDHRHEHRGDPVGQPLDRCLGLLRAGHEPGDLGELGVTADAGGPHHQAP